MRKVKMMLISSLWLLVSLSVFAKPAGENKFLPGGWQEIEQGVYQKQMPNGSIARMANAEGRTWVLQQMEDLTETMIQHFEENPTEKQWARIQEHQQNIEAMKAEFDAGVKQSKFEEDIITCFNGSSFASAGERSASASASWFSPCGWAATVFAYAYVQNGDYNHGASEYKTGTSVRVNASVSDTTACVKPSTYARAYYSYNGIYYDVVDSNDGSCTEPLSAYLIVIPEIGTPLWEATVQVSGGSGLYSYNWSYTGSGSLFASGNTASLICYTSGTLTVVITDNKTGERIVKSRGIICDTGDGGIYDPR